MSRGLSTEIKAAIAAGTVRPVYLVYFDFAGYTLRTWSGEGDLSYDSQTWAGDGTLQGLPSIAETGDLRAERVDFTLTGNPDTAVDLSDPAVYQGRTCEVYIGFVNAAGALPAGNVYLAFRGRVSQVSFSSDADTEAWTVSAESRLVDLQRVKASRWTHEEQRGRYPGGAVLSSGDLVVGELYEVTNAGTGADFSASGGPASPTLGDRFIATDTTATWGSPAAELTSLTDNGCAYAAQARTAVALFRDQEVPGPYSRKLVYGKRRLTPTIVFAGTSGSSSRYLHLVCAVADHACESIDQLYIDDRAVLSGGSVAGEFVGYVDYYERLGTANQAHISELTTAVGSAIWDEQCRLRGVTYIYIRLLTSDSLFGETLPFVEVELKGKKLYDPRDSSTAYSKNAALVVRDYLLSAAGFTAQASEVNDVSFSAAATTCAALVSRADGSSEPRYEINGVIDTGQSIGGNLAEMLKTMAAQLVYVEGAFYLRAGSWTAPTVTLSEADLIAPISLQNQNRRSLSNGGKGVFANPERDWSQEDYPHYVQAAALAADGEARDITLDLPLTTSPSAAQRLAKIFVNDSRRSRAFYLLCNIAQFDVLTGDVITLAINRLDYTTQTFRVESMRLEPSGMAIGVRLDVREMDSGFYDWDETTEEKEIQVFDDPSDVLNNWVNAKLAPPSGTPGSQSFTSTFNVTVSHNETDVTCYYTLNGSEPTEADSSVADGGTIQIVHENVDKVLKLKTFANTGDLVSDVVTYNYTATLVAPAAIGELYSEVDGFGPRLYLRWRAESETENGEAVTLMSKDVRATLDAEKNYSSDNNEILLNAPGVFGGGTFREDNGFLYDESNDDYVARTQANGHLDSIVSFPAQEAQPLLVKTNGNLGIKLWFFIGTANGIGENNVKIRSRKRERVAGSAYGAWGVWTGYPVSKTGYDCFSASDGYKDMELPMEDVDWVYQYEVYAFNGMWPDSIVASLEGQE